MLTAQYVDGHTTRVRAVTLELVGSNLVISGEDVALCVPFSAVRVDERLGRANRRLRLPDGGICEVGNLVALDGLLASAAHRDGWIDRSQRRLGFIGLSLVVFLLVATAAYLRLVPWAAAYSAARIPPAVAGALSERVLLVLDGHVLLPSHLGEARQRALKNEVQALRLPEGGAPIGKLLFRRSPQLGANAFALPDGTIVILDDLIADIDDNRQILAVISHELGHVRGHDGIEMLLRSSVVGAALVFYIGDFSALLAVAPTALVQAKYSQDLERRADDYGAALLSLNGMSSALLADALVSLTKSQPGTDAVPYLSSHPPTVERIRHLREMGETPHRR